VPVQFVLDDFAIECVPVDAKYFGGLGLIPTRFCERVLDEFLLEFGKCFRQKDAPFDHFGHEGFQLLFHNFFLRVDSYEFIARATTVPSRGSRRETLLSVRRE
jgi:hypothetical protein